MNGGIWGVKIMSLSDEYIVILHKKIDLISELLINILKEDSPRTVIKYYNEYEELIKETEEVEN